MSDQITWEDPPPLKRGGQVPGHQGRFVDALKASPGRWAVYSKDCNSSVGTRLRELGCETQFVGGHRKSYRGTIYARWPEAGA